MNALKKFTDDIPLIRKIRKILLNNKDDLSDNNKVLKLVEIYKLIVQILYNVLTEPDIFNYNTEEDKSTYSQKEINLVTIAQSKNKYFIGL
jgi:hypothetical protein